MNILPISQTPLFSTQLPVIGPEKLGEIEAKAADTLKGGPSAGFDLKGFVQLNCASSLDKTGLEGDVPSRAFAYLAHLLDKMGNVEKMKRIIDELIHFDRFHGSTEELTREILGRCRVNGVCYLPSGWATLDGGHYLSLKVRLIEGSRVAFSVLNQGDGMGFHAPFKDSKGKRDFQSTEFEIDLQSKEGIDFLSRIRQFKKVEYDEKIASLSSKELDGLLRIYGIPLKRSDFRAATPQRTGVCPSANTRAALKDALPASEKEVKTFQYQLKRVSIIEAYQCGAHQDLSMVPFLKDALNEWDVRLLKLYPEIISAEEFALDQAIIKKIRACLAEAPKKEALVTLETLEIPIKPSRPIPAENHPAKVEEKSLKRLQLKPAAELNPDAVAGYLDQVLAFKEKSSSLSLDEFMQIHQLMINLPTRSGEEIDPFWDKVPENQIASIFTKLSRIKSILFEFYGFAYLEANLLIELHLISYDIAAQLAPRLSELKLGRRFTPALNRVFANAGSFENPASYQRIKRIYANFDNRCKGKKKILGHVISKESGNDTLNSIKESTREYVMDILLSEWEKKKARKFFKDAYEPIGYSDTELFTDLMSRMEYGDSLSNAFESLVSLSVAAHATDGGTRLYYHKQDQLVNYGYLQCSMNVLKEELMEARLKTGHRFFECTLPPEATYNELHRCIENISFHPGRANWYYHSDSYFEGRPFGTSKHQNHEELIDPQIDEDLRHIEAEPVLRVQKCLEWAAQNVDRLSDKNVQNRIDSLLFQYGLLDQALEAFPEDLLHLYRMFEAKFFQTYLAEKSDTLLWGIEVVGYLKEHMQTHPVAAKFPLEGVVTRPILIDLLQKNGVPKRKIAQLIIQSLGHEDNSLEMLKWGFYAAKFYAGNPTRLGFYTAALLMDAKERQFTEEELQVFGNEVFKLCTNDATKRQWRLIGRQLQAGDITLDLNSLKITKSQLTISDLTEQLQDNPLMIQFFGSQLPPMTLREEAITWMDGKWETKGHILIAATLDGKWQIQLDTNCQVTKVVQRFILKGQTSQWTFENDHWKAGDATFTYSGQTGWLSSGSNFTEKLLLKGDEWVPSGELRLNEKEAYKNLTEYGECDLFFTNGEPARLQKVIFTKLGLSFMAKGENLECVEHPGFLLWQSDIPGAFLLKKGNETKVLIPPYSLSSKKSLAFGGTCQKGELLGPSFSYTLGANGDLEGECPEANLYLALLYRGQNEFQKAKKALEASETFEKNSALCWSIFDLLESLPNKSPAAVAFDCQMTYRMEQHAAKWSKKGEIKTVDAEVARERFSLYKQYESTFKEGVSVIPDFLRLTLPMVSSTQTAAYDETLALDHIGCYGDSFNEQLQNKEPEEKSLVRVTGDKESPGHAYLMAHYYFYLQKALSKDSAELKSLRADLFFLLHNDTKKEDQTRSLITSLLYVMQFPDQFNSNTRYVEIAEKRFFSKEVADQIFFDQETLEPQASAPTKSFPHFKVTPPPFSFALPNFEVEKPLESLYKSFCLTTYKKPSQEPFPLKAEMMKTPLEKMLVKNYEEGYAEYQKRDKEIHQLQEVEKLNSELATLKKADEASLKELERKLLKTANAIPETDVRGLLLQAAQRADQPSKINLSDLLEAFLNKDPSIITGKNCFIKETGELFKMVANYCLTKSRISQTSEALELLKENLDPYVEQRVGAILAKKRSYDITKYPEFLIYEYATGKILTEEQVKVLLEVLEGNNADHFLLQFAAGGGKTAVIIPILARLFAARGYLPVIVNTNELYSIGIQDIPESLKACFKQRLEVLEREIDHAWSVKELEDLKQNLASWRKDKKTLLIKAVTWHSIHTTKKIAYANKEIALAKAAAAVLDELKAYGLKLEDESQLNSDPLQQTIRSYGKRVKIPVQQQKLFLYFYDVLAKIYQRSDKELSVAELCEIQTALIGSLGKFFDEATLSYLAEPSKTRPAWLKTMEDKDKADLIVMAKAFIHTHLAHVIGLQGFEDYGPSIHEGDLTAAPKHEGKDSTSHFSDPGVIMALTIQMTYEEGIPPAQVKLLLKELKILHGKEIAIRKGEITSSEKLFLSIVGENDLFLEELSVAKIEELSHKTEIQKNPRLMKRYLLNCALPQIEMPTLKATSTAAEMDAGFCRGVKFSATPGPKETYPVCLTGFHYQKAFEAEVVHTLLQPKNSAHCLLGPYKDPASFMEQLPSGLTALIDRGALLCHEKPSAVATSYKSANLSAYFEEGVMKGKYGEETFTIPGTKLLETMKKRGIKGEVMLYFDLSKTTGTDVTQNYKAKAGLTIGKEQTVTEVIQAAMRQRLLLWDNAQTIVWIMQKGLSEQISKDFDPLQLFYWMVRNEAKAIRTKLEMRAYQGIHQIVENHVWNLIERGEDSLIETTIEEQKTRPFDIYELETVETDPETALQGYTNDLARHFRVALTPKEQETIKQIIDETKALIEEMKVPHGAELNGEQCQEQQTEQEKEIEQQLQVQSQQSSHVKLKVEAYGDQDLLTPDFWEKPRGTLISENAPPLYIPEQFYPFESEPAIKPIRSLLVTLDGTTRFLALTASGSAYYYEEMKNTKLKCAIVSGDGHIFCSTLTPLEKETLLQSEELKEMTTYAAFLNGEMKDARALHRIVVKYNWSQSDYNRMVNLVTKMRISCHPLELNSPHFDELCGWNKSEEEDIPLERPPRQEITLTRTQLKEKKLEIVKEGNPALQSRFHLSFNWKWLDALHEPAHFYAYRLEQSGTTLPGLGQGAVKALIGAALIGSAVYAINLTK